MASILDHFLASIQLENIDIDHDRRKFESTTISTLIELARHPDYLHLPSEFLAAELDSNFISKLKAQFEKCIELSKQSFSKDISNYLYTFCDVSETSTFSLISRAYLLWYFSLASIQEEIRKATQLISKPHGAVQAALIINFQLATVPLLYLPNSLEILKSTILTALQTIKTTASYPPSEELALKVTVVQIIARAARLGWDAATLHVIADTARISSKKAMEIQQRIAQSFTTGSFVRYHPETLFSSSAVCVVSALATGIEQGFCSLVDCALHLEVLNPFPLITPLDPLYDDSRIKLYLQWEYRPPDLSEVEKLTYRGRFQGLPLGTQQCIQLVQSTLENKLLVAKDPRKPHVLNTEVPINVESLLPPPPVQIVPSRAVIPSASVPLVTAPAPSSASSVVKKERRDTMNRRMDDAITAAMKHEGFERIYSLLLAGNSPSHCTGDGMSIMMAAAAAGSAEDISRLYHKCNCPMVLDPSARTPSTIARDYCRPEDIVRLLEKLQALEESFKE